MLSKDDIAITRHRGSGDASAIAPNQFLLLARLVPSGCSLLALHLTPSLQSGITSRNMRFVIAIW
jgi:hypothetical protein